MLVLPKKNKAATIPIKKEEYFLFRYLLIILLALSSPRSFSKEGDILFMLIPNNARPKKINRILYLNVIKLFIRNNTIILEFRIRVIGAIFTLSVKNKPRFENVCKDNSRTDMNIMIGMI